MLRAMGYMTEQVPHTSKEHMVAVPFGGLTGAQNVEAHNPLKFGMDLR